MTKKEREIIQEIYDINELNPGGFYDMPIDESDEGLNKYDDAGILNATMIKQRLLKLLKQGE